MALKLNGLAAYAPKLLAVLRIMAGLLFLEHGTAKLLGFPVVAMYAGHLPTFIVISGILEIGGALIALGLFTRIVAFLLSGEMAVGYFMRHMPNSFFPVINGGDAAVLYCFIFLYLFFAGPGAWSVDALIAKRK